MKSPTASSSPFLLSPGVRLMQRLRMPVKLGLIGAMLLVPLMALLLGTAHRAWGDWERSRTALDGASVLPELVAVASAVQLQRDLVRRRDAGDLEADTPMRAAGQALAQRLQGLQPTADRLPAEWPALAERLGTLAADEARDRPALIAALSGQVVALDHLMHRVAEDSGLLLDPDATTHFRVDAAVTRLLPWLESLSALRGTASALLARGEQEGSAAELMHTHVQTATVALGDMALRMDALQRAGAQAPAGWADARAATERLIASARTAFGPDAPFVSASDFFGQGSTAIEAAAPVREQLVNELLRHLRTQADAQATAMAVQLGLSALCVALVLYLSVSFYVNFQGGLRRLHHGMQAVTAGDLAQHIQVPGQDELAEIGRMVEGMNDRLSAMVAQIRSSAVRVGMSGQQVAVSSQSLAERTDAQAANLRQTVETVGQLSDAVANNAAAAGDLDQLTEHLRSRAEAGGGAMNDAISAMSGLEDSSRRVGEIIGVIDGIAFQTNILALNAAVEAARAGEAGRGFAVVAAEVRQLAQRSAEAAGEIRGLIARSTEQVDATVQQTRQVGETLGEVVTGVHRVSDALRAIAEASARQSADLEEVSRSVGALNDITRDNAGMVDESAGASRELVQRADALSGAVASIRLRQGSADEAHALVLRGLQLIERAGFEGALAELHSREAGFVDRDLYVFVLDAQGHYRVHGAKPETEGKRVHDIPGIDGDRFMADVLAAAPSGGWVEYDIVNPETGAVQPKASYVQALPNRLIIGCGVYRHDALVAA